MSMLTMERGWNVNLNKRNLQKLIAQKKLNTLPNYYSKSMQQNYDALFISMQ